MRMDYVLELPNKIDAIDRTVRFLMDRCRESGFDPDRLRLNFRVGMTEALTNAMLYGNANDPRKRVQVEAKIGERVVTVRVTDEGGGFDPRHVPDPTLPSNRRRASGRGVFLIRQLMDRVEYNERGNSITMVLLSEPRPLEREKARA